jgi:Domain of unknown function (DUF4123)
MKDHVQTLSQYLFADPDTSVFAVLDGASVPGLIKALYQQKPDYVCLYRGELKPDLAECAPYLVELKQDSEFTKWVLEEGWGKHWGIFAGASANMVAMRKHFRTFLMVRNPEDKQVYFRYYDPRVLRIYLPTCNPAETQVMFGPVKSYFCEDEKPEICLAFRSVEGLPKKENIRLIEG